MNFFNRFCLSLAIFLIVWAVTPVAYSYGISKIQKNRKKKDDETEMEEIHSEEIPSLKPLLKGFRNKAEELLFERS